LYLTGLRIEQFHDPNLDPEPYWEEALRRDPGDVRVNTALGIKAFRQARYTDAERLLRKALDRLTAKYTMPKDAEALYYLGMTLKAEAKLDDAYTNLFKSTWDLTWRGAGYYSLAEIASTRGDMSTALEHVNSSLESNGRNIRALTLKAAVLRHLGHTKEAHLALDAAHEADPLDVRLMTERWLLTKSATDAKAFAATMNEHPATAAETAAEYLDAGLWKDGGDVLDQAIAAAPDQRRIHAMVYYFRAFFAGKLGQEPKAAEYFRLAAEMPPDYVFPFQPEAIDVLRAAMRSNSRDARAPYYLGNLLFDWQPDEAIRLWESSASIDSSFAIAHRNLAIARSHRKSGNALDKAIASLETAVSRDRKYPIHFYELDQLYEAAGVAPEKRLTLLEQNHALVNERDDALNREISLKVALGKYDDAIRYMTGRRFAVWEGGTLDVTEQWMDAHLFRARQHLAANRYQQSLADLETARKIPENLPSERFAGGLRDAEFSYWVGAAYAGMGRQDQAKEAWRKATEATAPERGRMPRRRPVMAGVSPMMIQRYYQALALEKLGQPEKAAPIFQTMVDAAKQTLERSPITIDADASFEEQQRARQRLATTHYVSALGYMGLKDTGKAKQSLSQALAASPDHVAARATSASLATHTAMR
jgi:tetratricopeptide (TPR) repeat protein